MKNKISRFRTKKYLVFAPNHFVLYWSGNKLVTFSHQKCDVLVTLSHQNSLHGAKTLPFSFDIGTKEKISNSHQIFTFWHQVLQNKTFRFRTKKYLDFAPNHFLLYRSGTKMVTFPHQKCYVLVTLSYHNSLHGAKTLLFTSKIGRIKKVFGAKTRYSLVRKRDVLFCRTWCQNVNVW